MNLIVKRLLGMAASPVCRGLAVLSCVLPVPAAHAQSAGTADATVTGVPVASFYPVMPADPAEAAIRQRRNQRFNLSQGVRFTEDEEGDHYLSFHPPVRSEKDLVDEADVIVEGTVEAAAAFLSQSRSVVYSEFRVRVVGVLKDRTVQRLPPPVQPGDVLTVLREGGALRVPNGTLIRQHWGDQQLPVIAERYILFLRREPSIEAFTIITGYSVKESEVTSLDWVFWFPRYRGAPLEPFRQQILMLVGQSGGG